MTGILECYAFNWIEEPWSYKSAEFEVSPTENFALAVDEVVNSGFTSRNWIYPPIVERMDENVAGPTVRFLLRHTHYLKIDPSLDRANLSDFVILALGFFLGLQLCPAGIGHLHRTARRKGQLVGFVDVGRDLEHAIKRVLEFFIRNENNREILALSKAAFHWYLTSQSYRHAFEVFGWQYSVLDNLHRLTELLHPSYHAVSRMNGGHVRRPVNLSSFYAIPLPEVFEDGSVSRPNAARLANLRNELVHEAQWLGHPLGYSADSESWDILQSLLHFNSQLLLAAVGVQCRFRSAQYDQQIHALDVTT